MFCSWAELNHQTRCW